MCIFSTIKKDISDVELGERATQILPHTLTQAPRGRRGGWERGEIVQGVIEL